MTDQTHYLTVVYQINDQQAFEVEYKKIMDHMRSPNTPGFEVIPWSVIRTSPDHEIHRLELIEMAREEGKLGLIGEILDACGVDQIISLDELSDMVYPRNRERDH